MPRIKIDSWEDRERLSNQYHQNLSRDPSQSIHCVSEKVGWEVNLQSIGSRISRHDQIFLFPGKVYGTGVNREIVTGLSPEGSEVRCSRLSQRVYC